MTIKDGAWFIIVAAVYLGVLLMLVRPNSPGPQLVTAVSEALSDLVKGIAGSSNG